MIKGEFQMKKRTERFLVMILGILIMIASVVGGIYFGVWKCLIKAIIDIISAIGTRFVVLKICVSLFKILFGSWFTVSVAVMAGVILAGIIMGLGTAGVLGAVGAIFS